MSPVSLLTAGQVENQILRISDELDDETHRYAQVAEMAAEAEANFKGAYHRAFLEAADADGARVTVPEREARAHLAADEAFRVWKIMEARQDAGKQAQQSMRARLDALRTIAANIRAQS